MYKKYYLYNIIHFRPTKTGLLYNNLLKSFNSIDLIPYYLKRNQDLIYIADFKQFETIYNKYTKSIGFFTN